MKIQQTCPVAAYKTPVDKTNTQDNNIIFIFQVLSFLKIFYTNQISGVM